MKYSHPEQISGFEQEWQHHHHHHRYFRVQNDSLIPSTVAKNNVIPKFNPQTQLIYNKEKLEQCIISS